MNAELVHLTSQLPDPLFLAGAFLVAGFLSTRLVFHNRPVWKILCQVVSFAGFTVMLVVAGVNPSEPTPAQRVFSLPADTHCAIEAKRPAIS